MNPNASPAVFFDNYGHSVVPLLGGLAIRDINAEETQTIGYFSPKQHDGGGYVIQSSYSFVDENNRRVCPTSNNHVLMLKATDEEGNVLPEFEKVLDIDIKAAAEAITGKTLDQNLLSVVFDYEGNLGLQPADSESIRNVSSKVRWDTFQRCDQRNSEWRRG